VIYTFHEFKFDIDRRELWCGPEERSVEPQVFSLLAYLIENRDRVISKEELMDSVWEGRIVSDATLNTRINMARKALGDSGKEQTVIRTIPRRGFRFVAEIARGGAPLPNKPSIAILAFDNISGDPDQEYFSDGVTEDIITALSHIRQFRVTARNSSFTYKGQSVDVRNVARELGVRYVLEGSVRKSNRRVRVTAQLIDGESGNHLWAERYDRELEDIFTVQDEITHTIVAALQPEITRSEIERALQKPPESLDAWDLYQRGLWHLYRNNKEDIAAARQMFEQAVDAESDFIGSYVGIVECDIHDLTFGYADRDPRDTFAPARKAIEIDPQNAAAHKSLGMAHFVNRDHPSAITELKLAIQLNPNDAHFYPYLGFAQSFSGLAEEALANFSMALKLSPRDPRLGWFQNGMGVSFLHLQRHEECIEWVRKALKFPDGGWPIRSYLISALAHLGRMDECKQELAELLAIRPDCTISGLQQSRLTTCQAYSDHYAEGLRKAGLPE
jgi:TolB-like protein